MPSLTPTPSISRSSLVGALVCAAVFGLAVMGCKQGVGDRCQLDSDCDNSNVCVLLQPGQVSAGGVCEPVGFTAVDMLPTGDQAGADLATAPDMAMAIPTTDGGVDMTSSTDGALDGALDAGIDAGRDAAFVDAGLPLDLLALDATTDR